MQRILDALIGLHVFFWLFAEWNLRRYRCFDPPEALLFGTRLPKVSVLVPCRNEEKNASRSLRSFLKQNYPDFEVVALDDRSEDRTRRVLEDLSAESRGALRVLEGGELLPGLQGKNNACHQLAETARGEWLLFVDADTEADPELLVRAVATVLKEKSVFLSTFPSQITPGAIGLLVPTMFFILFSYLPFLFLEKAWRWCRFVATGCGQFILIRRDWYQKIGGHAALGERISEGPLLASRVKAAGGRILLRDGSRWISCRMYAEFRDAWAGFARSVFASMGGSVGAILFFIAIQTAMYTLPALLFLGWLAGGWGLRADELLKLIGILLLPVLVRWRIHHRLGLPLRWIGLHFVSILLYHAMMLRSFWDYRVARRTSWKGRAYANPKT